MRRFDLTDKSDVCGYTICIWEEAIYARIRRRMDKRSALPPLVITMKGITAQRLAKMMGIRLADKNGDKELTGDDAHGFNLEHPRWHFHAISARRVKECVRSRKL